MRMLCERSLEHDNELYICFVDFEKAFDRVKWTKLWHNILKKIGIDSRDRRLISNLYLQQEAITRVGNGYSKPAYIGRWLRQGCPLSPMLFLIYSEMVMMIDAIEEIEEGIKVGGKLVNAVLFAYDQGVVAGSERGLQKLMDGLNRTAKGYDMKMN